MNIGVLGPGRIARIVVPTIQKLDGITVLAAASRSAERAEAFAGKYGIERAYGSYEDMLEDPDIDMVYITTPHSHHYEQMMLALSYGKNVLCEKSFTVNAEQARKVQAYAREQNRYVSEAIWTRYMPSRQIIQAILKSGIMGKVRYMTANLSYPISRVERIMKPELAGGALLDVGVYGLNFVLMHFGKEIDHIESSVQMTDTGVDGMSNITIFFRDGRMAAVQCGIYGRSDRKGIFYGEKGYMIVENINDPQSVSVYDTEDRLIRHVDTRSRISGYEHEFRESASCIAAGQKESRSMPMEDTVFVMEVMDTIRAQWGLKYPME